MTETTDRTAPGVLWVLSGLALIALGLQHGFVTGSPLDPTVYLAFYSRAAESFWYALALGIYALTSVYWALFFLAFGPRY